MYVLFMFVLDDECKIVKKLIVIKETCSWAVGCNVAPIRWTLKHG